MGTTLPLILDFSFDWRVFGYATGAALLTGILVGIVPALRASRANLIEVLNASGRSVAVGRHRFRSALVVAQVAGSLVLLIMAGLFARSLGMARHLNLGFDPNHVANFSFDPRGIGYTEAQGKLFSKQLLDRVRGLPGVESAGFASTVPFGYYKDVQTLQIDGYAPASKTSSPYAGVTAISPGYFRTMRIPMVRGHEIEDSDLEKTQRVAVINETMARMFWPNQDAIGRLFEMKDHPERANPDCRNKQGHPLGGLRQPDRGIFLYGYDTGLFSASDASCTHIWSAGEHDSGCRTGNRKSSAGPADV